METIGAILVVFVMTLVVIVGAGTVMAVRVTRRLHRRAESGLENLRLRAGALPGRPGRDVAVVRMRLRESLGHTTTVMAAVPPGHLTDDCVELAGMLERASRHLDRQLALLEREPDQRLRETYLAVVLPRSQRVLTDASALRETVYALHLQLAHEPVDRAVQADLRDRIDGLTRAVSELTRAV